MPDKLQYSDEQINRLIRGVYDGTYDKDNLPEDLYNAVADYLKKSLYEGYGGDLSSFEIGGTDYELLSELRDNIHYFSAAKTYQQTKEMGDLLTKDDKITPWTEFRDAALDIYDQYNVNWLKSEYETTILQAQNAEKWNNIEEQKEVLPYLQYNAVEDANECEICEPLNGLTAPVDDPIWDWAYPSLHFNCRCTVDQLDGLGDVQLTPDDEKEGFNKSVYESVDDVFRSNVGKDGEIFNDSHPYFDVPKEDKDYAKNNFGLPIPDTDKENTDDE